MKRFVPIVGLLLIPFLFYWKLFAWDPAERKVFRGDFLNQHYVWKSYLLTRVKQGEVPLWNPHILSGTAFHANPQVGLFYPPNYFLLAFHSDGEVSYRALEAFQLAHQVIAGIGMWLLLRWLGLGLGAAWTGALVGMFTGFFTTPGHHALVLTASWIPLVLYLTGRAARTAGARSIGLAAIAITMLLLAGHPQPAYYGVLLATAWAWYCGGWRVTLRRYAPALFLAVTVASVQLLPTYQLARDSTREGAGYGYSTTFDFSPLHLAGALVPRGQVLRQGEDPSMPLHIYVGIGSLFLAAIGIAYSRSQVRWFFGSVVAVSLLLAMGSNSFLFDLAYLAVPGFDRFRVPYRLLGLFTFGMAGLAALGMETLLTANRRVRRRLRSVVMGGLALLVILGAWSAYMNTQFLISPDVVGAKQILRLISGANWALVLVAINIVLLEAFRWQKARLWPAWVLLGLLLIDLGSFVKDRGLHPYRSLVRAAERPVTRLLRAQSYRARYVTDTNLENYSMLHGTEFVGGSDALVDKRYAALLSRSRKSANVLALLNVKFVDRRASPSAMTWFGPRFRSPLPLIDVPPDISPLTLRLRPAREVGRVRVLWSPLGLGGRASIEINETLHELPVKGPLELDLSPRVKLKTLTIRVEGSDAGVRIEDIELEGRSIGSLADSLDVGGIYLNLLSLPRAYFVPSCTLPNQDEEKAVDDLSFWTPSEGVRVTDCDVSADRDGPALAAVRITRYEPETVELELEAPQAGYVVLADTYRPGWRVEVDEEPVAVLRAQHAQRAVAVSSGRHFIRFFYRPRSLYFGAALSLFGLIMILICIFSARHRAEIPDL